MLRFTRGQVWHRRSTSLSGKTRKISQHRDGLRSVRGRSSESITTSREFRSSLLKHNVSCSLSHAKRKLLRLLWHLWANQPLCRSLRPTTGFVISIRELRELNIIRDKLAAQLQVSQLVTCTMLLNPKRRFQSTMQLGGRLTMIPTGI